MSVQSRSSYADNPPHRSFEDLRVFYAFVYGVSRSLKSRITNLGLTRLRLRYSSTRRPACSRNSKGKPFVPHADGHEGEAVTSVDGIRRQQQYDVVVIGAGAAGLAAAAKASSPGFSILVIEAVAIGGNAANDATAYRRGDAGNCTGVESVHRLYDQLRQSGVHLMMAHKVVNIACSRTTHWLHLDNGEKIGSRSVVVATGARYTRLRVPNYDRFEYHGIHYAATGMEAALCLGEDVVVVGAGHPAGQAAVFLAGTANHVHLVTGNDSLGEGMSNYLIERILHSPHITLHTGTEIDCLAGDVRLREVTWKHIGSCRCETHLINHLFMMTGLTPQSEWLQGQLEMDESGFVRTGFTHLEVEDSRFSTSRAGVFAIGDVRSGSVKRVISAVNEGMDVATDLHRYLGVGDGLET